MSTFPNILPTTRHESLCDGPTEVSAPATGLAGLFAEAMAQALSPASKESVALTGQKSTEIDTKNQQSSKVGQSSEVRKFYSSEASSMQIAVANVFNGNLGQTVIGVDKPGAQASALQSSFRAPSKSAGKSDEDSKTDKNSRSQAERTTTTPIPSEIQINQITAEAVSTVNLIPKVLSEQKPGAISAIPERAGMDESPAVHRGVSVEGKPISKTWAISTGTGNETVVASRSSAVSAAVPTPTKVADSMAKNADLSFNPTAVLSSALKSDAKSEHEGVLESDSTAKTAQESVAQASDSSGTLVAKQDVSVKQVEKTNNIAGRTEKVLPGNSALAAQRNSSLPVSTHFGPVAAAAPAGGDALENASAAAAIPVNASTSSGSNTSSVERTQEMITVNAVRLSDSGNNAMQVVIKPDAGTQLSLELRRHGSSVEVQAVLQQGNFGHLSQQWPDLQQRLNQRGIQLASLTQDATTVNDNGSGSFQQKQQHTAEPAAEFPIASLSGGQVAPTIAHTPLITSASGWETWA